MGKQSCLNLLIVSVILGQGIAVSSEESKEAPSSLLLRPKRSSKEVFKAASPEAPSSSGITGYLHPPRPGLEVGLYNPGRWEGRLVPGMVRIYLGNNEVGIGIMATVSVFVTKAHFLFAKFQPGAFHVEYADQYGDTISHAVIRVRVNALYREEKQNPWGRDDVCFATIEEEQYMPVVKPVSAVLKQSRLFTVDQLVWIYSRTGCAERAHHYPLDEE